MAQMAEIPTLDPPDPPDPPRISFFAETDIDDLSDDELRLRAQGHKGELPRHFSAFAAVGLAWSVTNSWVGYAATFDTALIAGAAPSVFWSPMVAFVACFLITAGLAEIASAFPSSGGQYHFAFMVSPPNYRAPVAFVTGWLSIFAWLYTVASSSIFCAKVCVGLAAFDHADYAPVEWQIWLIYSLFLIVGAVIVCLLPRVIPLVQSSFFWVSVVTFVASITAILAASDTKESASVVFTEWGNDTGWNDGLAFMLGVGQSMYAYLGTDAVTHISEEIPDPGRNVPRAMWLTMVLGITTLMPFTLAVLFSVDDIHTVENSALPIREVYWQSLNNKAGATFFTLLVLFIYFGGLIGLLVSSGRLIWAFSRDNGLPFSRVFAKTHPTLKTPVNATILAVVFCILYGLIYIGSTEAFDSFIATAVLSLNVTYVIPQAIVLLRGRKRVLPERQFDLGNVVGTFCNVFSCLWMALYIVLFCFPIQLPVQPHTMSYVSVVMAGTALFIAAMWLFRGRCSFEGPDVPVTEGRVLHRIFGASMCRDVEDAHAVALAAAAERKKDVLQMD